MAAMDERYRKWSPVPDLPQGASRLVELRDDAQGLNIRFAYDKRPEHELVFVFHQALAHRRSSFEVFVRMWRLEIPDPLYVVENSRWIEWLHRESDGQYASASLAHYVITTSRDFIEVLTMDVPMVEWR
jgi:hypothetical protein